MGSTTSILPSRAHLWSRAAAVVAVLATAVGGWSLWSRNHQTVQVLNGWAGDMTLRVDDAEPVTIAAFTRAEIRVGEGEHHATATVEGAELPVATFDTRRSALQRFAPQPVYVLNPGGLGAVLWEAVYYAESASDAPEPLAKVYAGKESFILDGTDYGFGKFPETISLSSKTATIRKTRVEFLQGFPQDILPLLVQFADGPTQLAYLESWLAVDPTEFLTLTYAGAAARIGSGERAAAWIRPQLTAAPVNTEMHRAYQHAAQSTGTVTELIREYDGLLAANPDLADLHYLRGRIELDPTASAGYYRRAIELDPQGLYAPRALGMRLYNQGHFEDAFLVAERLSAIHPDHAGATELLAATLAATGRNDQLEQHLRKDLSRNPTDPSWKSCQHLVQLLAATDRGDEAQTFIDEITAARREEMGADDPLPTHLLAELLYAGGDFRGLQQHRGAIAQQLGSNRVNEVDFWLAVEADQIPQAQQVHARLPDFAELGVQDLVMATLYARANVVGKAQKLQERALAKLSADEPGVAGITADLAAKAPLDPTRITDWPLEPRVKATLLTLLAVTRTEEREVLLKEADRLDFDPGFPHRFLSRVRRELRESPRA